MNDEPEIVKQLREEEKLGRLHSSGQNSSDARTIETTFDDTSEEKNSICEKSKYDSYEAKERFQTLVEDISDWIWEIDRNGTYTYSSPKVKDLLGYTSSKVTGKTLFDFMPTGENERIRATFQACVELKNPIIRLETTNLHKDGRIVFLETSGVPIIDGEGNLQGYRGVSRDVTERKKMEDELSRKNIELVEINKELEDYTYVISHDLKEPVRSLQAFSGFLLEEFSHEMSDTAKDYLERIQKASARMTNLINDLLKLSKIGLEEIKLEKIDLNELLNEVRDDLTGVIIQKQAEVKIMPLPAIKCNGTLIGELFKNLISNSIKFSEEKTLVEIQCDEQDKKYLFRIKDNGIGIEEVYLDKIFEVFTQINPAEKYGGTGLGLTICKKIVKKHGGDIWVESAGLGKGSTFYFTIPKNDKKTNSTKEFSVIPEEKV